jgi:hypothetical protein
VAWITYFYKFAISFVVYESVHKTATSKVPHLQRHIALQCDNRDDVMH